MPLSFCHIANVLLTHSSCLHFLTKMLSEIQQSHFKDPHRMLCAMIISVLEFGCDFSL